jgi:hypothetical protein
MERIEVARLSMEKQERIGDVHAPIQKAHFGG